MMGIIIIVCFNIFGVPRYACSDSSEELLEERQVALQPLDGYRLQVPIVFCNAPDSLGEIGAGAWRHY